MNKVLRALSSPVCVFGFAPALIARSVTLASVAGFYA